ncbi:DUF2142 domain-containing protein [Gluconobacter sp. DsW_058]|uniref:DUF2142 domain-containing protein n=1 Tax=Gluconobacter sp. DsW_058 TaxID=1511210 RepID=UPI000A378700|nr:DUF2142 domain-containing protein [Gluconobacter sp. DsW_058]OUJ05929.1 hypothetical protein HK24_11245 [Gluconobacter sp. DsW_058]
MVRSVGNDATTSFLYKYPLAIVWGLLVSACLMFLVIATPPLQVADEPNHFQRAIQISQGQLIGHRFSASDSGGVIPEDSVVFAYRYDDLKGRYERKVDWNRIFGSAPLSWKSPKREAGFPNTVIYSPIFYFPSVVGIEVGKRLHEDILKSFYLARMSNAVFCVLSGMFALAIVRQGRLIIAAFLSMPMSLSLFASCSQDGPLIAACAVCTALMTRLNDDFCKNRWFWPTLALLMGCIIASKPPYILIAFLPLIIAPWAAWRSAAGACVFAALDALAWSVMGVHSTKIPFRSADGVDAARQLHFVLSHPFKTITVLLHTFRVSASSLMGQFVGVLGWLDARLPDWFYQFEVMFFILVGIFSCLYLTRKIGRDELVRKALIFCVSIGTVSAVSLSLYLIWTPVGDSYIGGLQGRYYIPSAIFSVLIFPFASTPHFMSVAKEKAVEIALLTVGLWVGFGAIVQTILARYW